MRKESRSIFATLSLVVAAALLVGCAPTAAPTEPPKPTEPAAAVPTEAPAAERVELTFWFWGESDAPGAEKWLEETIAEYEKLNPNVKINMVPQSTDTLISAFTTAAQAKSGPDIASQWATIPVLSQVWAGAVTPISDLLPAEEIQHWMNTNENMYDGKLWAAPLYLMGIPMAYNKELFTKAGLDAENPPKTWDEFITACEALKQVGTPCIGAGAAKASAFGAWMFAILGVQDLDSVDDIKAAVVGDADFNSEKYTRWIQEIRNMLDKGYFNDNIASIGMPEGMDLFPQGKVATAWGTDGQMVEWRRILGDDKFGVMKTPVFGKGKLADAYNATQSTSYFVTSWSPHKEQAADFIKFMHDKGRLEAWYKATGVVPADDRFDTALIDDPLLKTLAEYNLSPVNVWLENFIPTQMDMDGLRPGGSMLASGASAQEVVDLIVRTLELWRTQNPTELETFRNWK